MKISRKINKGLVLTLIVLVILITYLIIQEIERGKEKESIIKSCEEYIDFIDKYSVFPENYQTVKTTITEEELKKYIETFKQECKQFTISNESVIDIQAKVISSNLEYTELSDFSITTKFDRKIKKIKSYEFDGNQVTVTLENDVKKEVKSNDAVTGEEVTNSNEFTATEDTITLQKEDGKWKIVYANLQNMSDNEYDMVEM